jgi:hypothetical protein
MWDNETAEVKAKVQQRMAEQSTSRDAKACGSESDEEPDDAYSPEKYQKYMYNFLFITILTFIDSMTLVLITIGKEVAERCGWVISMFVGGPLPAAGNVIQVARYVTVSVAFDAFLTSY